MGLEPALEPSLLYWALGEDANEYRPVFTGDVFDCIDIPGVGRSPGIIIGHPCSIRGRSGKLTRRIPVASVEIHNPAPPRKWIEGFFNRMPLAGLPVREGGFHVARLDLFGLASKEDLVSATRLACLSHAGINQLQQRIVFHLTRVAVPTNTFQRAFSHTYEECELLEDWITELTGFDSEPASTFEQWIREGDPTRQALLEEPQNRASIRREMRNAIERRKHRS